ncbi:MAG: TetR family transcriptional regulator [Methylococcales bacterium]|nr:TetR family transcriptional regulator [Methylococcales bacterium]
MNSKEKILIQAKKLFAKRGFSGVSMRNIASCCRYVCSNYLSSFSNSTTMD